MGNNVTVVIVNWNAGSQLKDCVDSVIAYGRPWVDKIVVVDNGSTDGSDRIIEGLPGVELVRTGANLGFARACNRGAGVVSSKFILFLNPDARIYPETLPVVMEFMTAPVNSQIGILGIPLVEEGEHVGRSCTRFPTVAGFMAHAIGLDRFFPRLGHFMSEWDHSSSREVDHVIGAFYFVRKQLFESLAGFDERFFVYLEDLDFSFRARKVGWRTMFLADAKAFHAGGGTSRQVKARRLFYSIRSRLLYAFKHFSFFGACLVMAVTLLAEPLARSTLALSRFSLMSLKETAAAYGMLFRWLPKWWFRGVTR